MAPSQPVKDLAMQLGKSEKEIVMIRSGVDKNAWQARLENFDRDAIRTSWSVPTDATVVLYCAKLQPWKRPLDLLRASPKPAFPAAIWSSQGKGPSAPNLSARSRVSTLPTECESSVSLTIPNCPALTKLPTCSFCPRSMTPVLL